MVSAHKHMYKKSILYNFSVIEINIHFENCYMEWLKHHLSQSRISPPLHFPKLVAGLQYHLQNINAIVRRFYIFPGLFYPMHVGMC